MFHFYSVNNIDEINDYIEDHVLDFIDTENENCILHFSNDSEEIAIEYCGNLSVAEIYNSFE